ncbi:MAG: HAD-IB family phosphatase [Planctomycetota bacterium]
MSVPDSEPPFAAIAFDCDSTLSTIEGIDELADPALSGQIAALTARAMAGEVPLEAVYGERLALIAPHRAELDALASRYLEHALPDARATIGRLQDLGKTVCVVSGGLAAAVRPFALALGIPGEQVFAVELEFDAAGAYRGYETESPLTRADGKPEIVERLTARFGATAFVGDGTTDLATAGVAARFVAFAGVVDRPAVTRVARYVVREPRLAACLPHLLTADELGALAR